MSISDRLRTRGARLDRAVRRATCWLRGHRFKFGPRACIRCDEPLTPAAAKAPRGLLRRVDAWLYWRMGPQPWHPVIGAIDSAPERRWRHLRDDPRFAETLDILRRIERRRAEGQG